MMTRESTVTAGLFARIDGGTDEQMPVPTHAGFTLGVARERVSIKAKSTDGMGAVGRGEGIAAQAVVLLRSQE